MKFLDFNGLQYLINKIKILLRGYEQSNTVFNSDGSITTTYSNGVVEKTVFNANGSITQTLTMGSVITTKTTTFTSNGVNETIS